MRDDVVSGASLYASRYERSQNLRKYLQLFPHEATSRNLEYYIRVGSAEQVEMMVDAGADPLETDSRFDFVHTAALNHSHGNL